MYSCVKINGFQMISSKSVS